MNQTRPLSVLSVALLALFVSLGGNAGAAHARPNIVVIVTDDQTVESMRVMNNVKARSVPGRDV